MSNRGMVALTLGQLAIAAGSAASLPGIAFAAEVENDLATVFSAASVAAPSANATAPANPVTSVVSKLPALGDGLWLFVLGAVLIAAATAPLLFAMVRRMRPMARRMTTAATSMACASLLAIGLSFTALAAVPSPGATVEAAPPDLASGCLSQRTYDIAVSPSIAIGSLAVGDVVIDVEIPIQASGYYDGDVSVAIKPSALKASDGSSIEVTPLESATLDSSSMEGSEVKTVKARISGTASADMEWSGMIGFSVLEESVFPEGSDGWYTPDSGGTYYHVAEGCADRGWLTEEISPAGEPGSEQLYWLAPESGVLARGELVESAKGLFSFATPNGPIVQGEYSIESGIYLADDDGFLRWGSATGWIEADYGSDVQRYYIDETAHSALTGFFQTPEGKVYGLPGGYALRGKMPLGDHVVLANSDGLLVDAEGWYETSDFDTERQRYYLSSCSEDADGAKYHGAQTGLLSLNGSLYYAYPDSGFIARSVDITVDGRRYRADAEGRLSEIHTSDMLRQTILNHAREAIGTPYVLGGHFPQSGGTDCSGLVSYAYLSSGLGWGTALDQPDSEITVVDVLHMPGHEISEAEAKPGDLIFWWHDKPNHNGLHHVGLWVDNGVVIESCTPTCVEWGNYGKYGRDEATWYRLDLIPEESTSAPSIEGQASGWFSPSGSDDVFYRREGSLAKGWLVTAERPDGTIGSVERYWLDSDTGALAKDALVKPSATGYAYATPDGPVVRGSYDDGAGRVYLANNDGNLLWGTSTGWVVSDYGSGLQRYFIDAKWHAAKSGFFSVPGYGKCFGTSDGYVARGKTAWAGCVLLSDNDGKLVNSEGWLVSSEFDGSLQRYRMVPVFEDEAGASYVGARTGRFDVDGSSYYGKPDDGFVARNEVISVDGRSYKADNDGKLTELHDWTLAVAPSGNAPDWGRDDVYLESCRARASANGGSDPYYITVDNRWEGGGRVIIFKREAEGWVALAGWYANVGRWTGSGGNAGTRSIPGLHRITDRIEEGTTNGNDPWVIPYFTDYLHWVDPDTGKDDGQGFHYTPNPNQQGNDMAGCTAFAEGRVLQAKWIFDNVPNGCIVDVFGAAHGVDWG